MKSYDSLPADKNKKWEHEGRAGWAMVAKVERKESKQHQHLYLLGLRAELGWTPRLEPLDYIAVLSSLVFATYNYRAIRILFLICPAFFRWQETDEKRADVCTRSYLCFVSAEIFLCAPWSMHQYLQKRKKKERYRFGWVGIGYRWWHVLPFCIFCSSWSSYLRVPLFFIPTPKEAYCSHSLSFVSLLFCALRENSLMCRRRRERKVSPRVQVQ